MLCSRPAPCQARSVTPGSSGGPAATSPTLGVMDRLPRRDAYVLLAVLGTGVFLAGLELMITAVALPAIVVDLADWTRLREASWIINGYLLVYVVTMPLAGRLADLWGNRRMFLAALALFTVGSLLAGMAPTLELLIAARLVQAVGGGILVPVATSAASHLFGGTGPAARAGRHRRADVPGDGRRPGAGRRDPRRVPPGGRALAPGPRAGVDARRRARAVVALGVLRQRPDRDRRVRGRVGGEHRLGDATARGPRRPRRRRAVLGVPRRLARGADPARVTGGHRGRRPRPGARLDGAGGGGGRRRSSRPSFAGSACRTRSSTRACSAAPRSRSATLVSALTGYGFATAIVGGAVFVDRVLYGGPDEQRLALGALAGATAVGALVSGFLVRLLGLRLVIDRRPRGVQSRPWS